MGRSMRDEVEAMLATARQRATFIVGDGRLSNLPEPVQAYLRAAGVAGKEYIRTVRLTQKGSFRRGKRWLPFTAEQYFAADPPGFVWEAKIRFFPFVSVTVIDKFVNGRGSLRANVLSVFKVAEAAGPEADEGELLRFLGEIAWFPTAWLSPFIEWESVNAHAAKATLRLPGMAVSAVAHFDEEFRLREVRAKRHMREDGAFVLRHWRGRLSDYQPRAGLLIPMRAKAAWLLESGEQEYFRGEITQVEYDI